MRFPKMEIGKGGSGENMLNNGYQKRAIRSALRRELRSIGKEFESGIRN